jgi:hypothetical protein
MNSEHDQKKFIALDLAVKKKLKLARCTSAFIAVIVITLSCRPDKKIHQIYIPHVPQVAGLTGAKVEQ